MTISLDFELDELLLIETAMRRLRFERVYPEAVTAMLGKISHAIEMENGMAALKEVAAAEGRRSRESKGRK